MSAGRRWARLGQRLLRTVEVEACGTECTAQPGGRAYSVLARRAAAAQLAPPILTVWAQRLPGSGAPSWLRAFAAAAGLPPHTELQMPALSPTMSHGNMLGWHKKEGDSVAAGDVYCEVETDKATMEWEAQEDGFLARILVPEGSKDVAVGTPVAIVVEDEKDVAAFKDYTPESGAPAAAAPSAEKPPAATAPGAAKPSGGSFPGHQVLAMPALSPTMSQGSILSWRKAAGDEVAAGDVIAEVETDKATMEWEAQEDGVVAKILVAEGTHGVNVGDPVIVMVDDKGAVAAFESFTAADAQGAPSGAPAAAEPEPAAVPAPAPKAKAKAATHAAAPRAAEPSAPGARAIASPYAKKLAREAGVSLVGMGGSGPGGRIVAADVQQLVESGGGVAVGAAAAAGPGPAAPAGAAYTDEEATQIRRVIARRLLESKQQIPHYYLTVNCRVDCLAALRQQLNASLAASPAGGKLSVNDFVIKAASLALRRVPEANASWHGDFIRQYHTVDCSVAVQTPAGLMVPVVRDSDKKGLAEIAAEVKDLATRAKESKLRPEEYVGGTFTISNLGMFGVSQFAAIINPPQAVILAVGAAEKRVVPAGGGFEEGSFMACTLSCDHRVVDGAVGAQWLQAFRGFIEEPASMLLF